MSATQPPTTTDGPRSGVLFDVDGTLVDSSFLHAVCWAEALRQHDQVRTTADVHHAIGMGSDELLDHLLGDARDRDQDDAIVAAHATLYRQFWGRLTALPGAADLVRACAKSGRTVVLASSASRDELEALRSALDADDAVDATTSASDAEAGKPSPDILVAALEQTGLAAGDCVFVGDSVWDAAAAGGAGITFVGLTCGGTPEEALRAAGAVRVWRDPADVVAHLDDLLGLTAAANGPARTGG